MKWLRVSLIHLLFSSALPELVVDSDEQNFSRPNNIPLLLKSFRGEENSLSKSTSDQAIFVPKFDILVSISGDFTQQ